MNVDHRYYIRAAHRHGDDRPRSRATRSSTAQQALDFVRFRHTDSDLYRNRPPAAVPRGAEGPAASGFSLSPDPEADRRGQAQRRDRAGRLTAAPSLSEIESLRRARAPTSRRAISSATRSRTCTVRRVRRRARARRRATCRRRSTVPAPGRDARRSRSNAAALGMKPKAPKQPALQAGPDHDARPQRDDRPRARPRHVVQARATQLPHGPAARDVESDADAPSQNYYSTYVYYDAVQPNARQAGDELKAAFGRTPSSRRCRPSSRCTRSRPATRSRSSSSARASAASSSTRRPHVVAVAPHEPPTRAQRPRRDAHVAPGRAQQGAVPDHGSARDRELVAALVARAGPRLQVRRRSSTSSRSTFVTGAGNVYWDVIETNWTSAPILRRPTDQHDRRRPPVRPLHDRRHTSTWSCSTWAGRATGSSTRCGRAVERDDDRHRQGPRSRSGSSLGAWPGSRCSAPATSAS